MPAYKIKYDPKRDVKKVSPIGALDLKEAFANNAVPSNLQSSESRYNGIDDPRSIVGRVSDIFDAEQRSHQLRTAKKPETPNPSEDGK